MSEQTKNEDTADFLEYGVWVANALVRRLWIYVLALALGLPGAYALLKYAPKEFVTEAVVLLQPATQQLGTAQASVGRQSAAEQLQVMQAWLTSDRVLTPLLPELVAVKIPGRPEDLKELLDEVRDALTFALEGQSILKLRLRGSEAEGLGLKLEVILARLIQGLLEPDQGVLSASQLLSVHWDERLVAARNKFSAAISEAGLAGSEQLEIQLEAIVIAQREVNRLASQASVAVSEGDIKTPSIPGPAMSPDVAGRLGEARARLARAKSGIKLSDDQISSVIAAASRYISARRISDGLKTSRFGVQQQFFGLFARPEQLTIIGRPADPVLGESSGLKLAAAVVLFSLAWPTALILFLELTSRRLKLRHRFVKTTGVPVVARFG